MRLHLFSRSLLAALLLTAWAGSSSAQTGRVGGTVKDEAGEPIRGAIVTAEFLDINIASVAATTDDKGRFSMVGLQFGEWAFKALAPGFKGQATNMNVRTGGVNRPLAFALEKTFVPPSALGTLEPKDLQAALAAADGFYNNQRWDEAIAAYRTILAQAPSLSVINLQIAAAYRNKKEFNSAIGAYTELLKADPSNDKAKVGIAMANLEKGDLDTAEQTLETAAQAPGAAREVFNDLGDVKLAKSKTDEAVKAYQRAAQADPTWGKPSFALGGIAMNKGDRDAARKYFQAVLDVDPLSPEAVLATTMLQQLDR